jgi:hypothetical protein
MKLSEFMKKRLLTTTSFPPKYRNQFTTRVPNSITMSDLPDLIRISKGEITIHFNGNRQAISLIHMLFNAIQFDYDRFAALCDPAIAVDYFDIGKDGRRSYLARLEEELTQLEALKQSTK